MPFNREDKSTADAINGHSNEEVRKLESITQCIQVIRCKRDLEVAFLRGVSQSPGRDGA